ncbi:MAG: hypothetical protein JXR94_15095, partial [Candidatus Hydrogenedentes bacterium]|nr:hypothetical protein [Candidatus Hydrogenedentota bacterium]
MTANRDRARPTFLDLGRDGLPLTAVDIVDMHAHIGPIGFSVPDVTAAGIVSIMGRTGVATTVAAPMPRHSRDDTGLGNRLVTE